MTTMYDAVDVAAIPPGAEIVAGYIDGNWPTYDALVAAFPNAQHVSIATGATGGAGARVADCETGDFTPASAGQWAAGEIKAGRRPCIYYSKAAAPAVAQGLKDAGVSPTEVDFWIADWTGQAHLIPGSVATQWGSPSTGSGGNFDVSETDGTWPAAPAPDPQPEPPSTEENESVFALIIGSQTHVWAVVNGKACHWWQETLGPDFTWHPEYLPEPKPA